MVKFTDIKWNSRRLEVTGTFEDKGTINLWFEASQDWMLNDNIIAIALTTLCGRRYQKIFFDLNCDETIINYIHQFTGADITCNTLQNEGKRIGETTNIGEWGGQNTYTLCFSGGFDSLSAYCLMPKDTCLISMDFGEKFYRERVFFEKFAPIIVKSNFREYGFEKNSWTFMGMGAILFSGELNIKYNIFGSILEATWWQFQKNPVASYDTKTAPFYGLGIEDIRITNAFTEVGTVLIVTKYLPDLVNASLSSLSNNRTEKRYRKWLLVQIVCRKFGRNITIDMPDPPEKIIEWGKNLALDFLALYELKNTERFFVEKTVSNIPEEAIELVNDLQLNFYERMNTNFLGTIPENMISSYMQRVTDAGILPYTENDWYEFDRVVKLLSKYHGFER